MMKSGGQGVHVNHSAETCSLVHACAFQCMLLCELHLCELLQLPNNAEYDLIKVESAPAVCQQMTMFLQWWQGCYQVF